MKNIIFIPAIFAIAICGCSHKKDKHSTDPTHIVVPSNSDATNPSLADTAYHNDELDKKKDSAKKSR